MIARPIDLKTPPITITPTEPVKENFSEWASTQINQGISSARETFNSWTWSEKAKYGAITVLGVAAVALTYSELWRTAKKTAETAHLAVAVFKEGAPHAASAVNDVIFLSDIGAFTMGVPLSLIRSVARFVGIETDPMPLTPEDVTALGAIYAGRTAVTGAAASVVAAVVSSPIMKPLMPKLDSASAVRVSLLVLALLGIRTATYKA